MLMVIRGMTRNYFAIHVYNPTSFVRHVTGTPILNSFPWQLG